MAIKNNVMIVRQKLLTKLIELWKEDQLVAKIDRLPLELSPRNAQPKGAAASTRSAPSGNTNRCPCWATT